MGLLESYISEGEHQRQDFKFRVDDAKKIARTLAAFSNTEGGRLLIGVKDNGKVIGINPQEENYIIEGAASLYCKPSIKVTYNVLQDKHKFVLEVNVPAHKNRPIKAPDENNEWKVYVRREDHTLLANKILLGVWKEEKKKTSRPQVFGEDEVLILKIISELNNPTISEIYKNTTLKKSVVDRLLIRFIYWNLVEMIMTPTGTFYKTVEPIKEENML